MTSGSQKGDEFSRQTLLELIVTKPLQAVGYCRIIFELEGTLSQRLSPFGSCFFQICITLCCFFCREVLLAANDIIFCVEWNCDSIQQSTKRIVNPFVSAVVHGRVIRKITSKVSHAAACAVNSRNGVIYGDAMRWWCLLGSEIMVAMHFPGWSK